MLIRGWQRLVGQVSEPFAAALLLSAGFMAFTGWDHSHWWRTREDYGFGWLVPAFVLFVVHDRWRRIRERVAGCRAPGSPRATGWSGRLVTAVSGAALAGGALLFLLGAFYRAGAGPSQPGSLALALGTAGVVLPLLVLTAPASPAPAAARWWQDARWPLVGLFLFPSLVWLVAAPMVSAIENQLSLVLLRGVTRVVFFVFDLLGLPLQQEGNTLVLPPVVEGVENRVGVEQACSGIRSLTACLFAGSFLAAVFLDRLWKQVALVGAALGFAFLTNLARSLFLTGWAYRYGHDAIEGTVHDVAGYAVLGLTVLGLLALLPLFSVQFGAPDEESGEAEPVAPR